MTPWITLATAARVGAMAFVVAAIAAVAVHLREVDRRPPTLSSLPPAEAENDPLRAELRRCQLLGEAGAHDEICLRAWAENRARFLRLAAPMPTPSATEIVAKPPSPPNSLPSGAPTDRPTAQGE